jgi:hypothetical protein
MSQVQEANTSAAVLEVPGLSTREKQLLTLAVHAFLNREPDFVQVAQEAKAQGMRGDTVDGIREGIARLKAMSKGGTSLSDLLKKAMGSGGCCS